MRGNPDIWVKDLERGTQVRVTTATEPDMLPVWSPGGNRLAYVSGNPPGRPGKRNLSIAAADGTGVIRTFPCPGGYCEPTDWTHDGLRLIVNVRDARGSTGAIAARDRCALGLARASQVSGDPGDNGS